MNEEYLGRDALPLSRATEMRTVAESLRNV